MTTLASPSRPSVSVVIVNYETSALVARCVESLRRQEPQPQIIVVDNPSPANDAANLAPLAVEVVLNKHNVGYGLGCNAGAAHANGDLICILNPDTIVPAGALARWVGSFARLRAGGIRAGLVAPRLANENGTIQRSAYQFVGFATYWLYHSILAGALKKLRKAIHLPDHAADASARPVPWVMGAALLIPREAWNEIGGFAPKYFMYAEDTDLCWRLREKGWLTLLDPSVTITHSQGEASAENRDRAIRRFFNGLATFIGLRYGPLRRLAVRVAVILDMVLRLVLLAPLLLLRPRDTMSRKRAAGYGQVLRQYLTTAFPPPRDQ